jgi:hypothetical protein
MVIEKNLITARSATKCFFITQGLATKIFGRHMNGD